MSDLIRLEHGQPPWKPTVDSQNIRVYDEYDIPLTGVIQQDGCFYLFNCSAGRLQLGSMWFYNLISSADLAALDDLEGEEFENRFRSIRLDGPARIALSLRNEGLVVDVDAADMKEHLPSALDELVNRFERYAETISRGRQEVQELRSSMVPEPA